MEFFKRGIRPGWIIVCLVLFVILVPVLGQVEIDPIERQCELDGSDINDTLIYSVQRFLVVDIYPYLDIQYPQAQEVYFCYQGIINNLMGFTRITKWNSRFGIHWFNAPFNVFTQGYHTLGIPAVDYWSESREFFRELRLPLVNIREVERLTHTIFFEIFVDCKEIWERSIEINNTRAYQSKANCTTYTRLLNKCLRLEATVIENEVRPAEDNWYHRLLAACHQSLTVLMEAFYRSVIPLYYNGNAPKWDYSPMSLMLRDTTEYEIGVLLKLKQFPAYIAQVRADGHVEHADFLQTRLDDIDKRLKDPSLPYKDIYYKGNFPKMISDRNTVGIGGKGLAKFTEEVRSLRNDKEKSLQKQFSFQEHAARWRKDIRYFRLDLHDGTVKHFANKLLGIFQVFVQVDASSEPAYENGILVRDGKWEWKPTKNGLHNMRLAWDLMGAVLEELKCYMKQTYFFDLRQKAIRDTQLDLEAGALFSGISYTMFYPCRIDNNNEPNLATKYCTAENHEICAPIAPFAPQQRPESEHHGGLGLLKPRWIYKVDDEKTGICKGRRDYFTLMYACRCGFRLDCGDDLGENITCQMINNDHLRGQCRGGVAYPCKTLPLAPGKHNETCASGYCHMRRNSCEDKPFIYAQSNDGIPVMRMFHPLNRFVVQFLSALVAARNGAIFVNL